MPCRSLLCNYCGADTEHGYERWLQEECQLSSYEKAKPALMAGVELLHGQGAMRVCCVGVGQGAAPAMAAGQVSWQPDQQRVGACGCGSLIPETTAPRGGASEGKCLDACVGRRRLMMSDE